MEISENGKKAIDSFIKWMEECKKNQVYTIQYFVAGRIKLPLIITPAKSLDQREHDMMIVRVFKHFMIMNFVSFEEFDKLIDLAYSKNFWDSIKETTNGSV